MTPPAPEAVPARVTRAVVLEPAPVILEDDPDGEVARLARFELPPQNGTYRGKLKPRWLPPGVGGEDLRERAETRLVAGAVWFRGAQRVRVEKVTPTKVKFREVSHGAAMRMLARGTFISQARPDK